MTVQQLIEQLQQIENKQSSVFVFINSDLVTIDSIDDLGDRVDLTVTEQE